jgi:hypothetical protein
MIGVRSGLGKRGALNSRGVCVNPGRQAMGGEPVVARHPPPPGGAGDLPPLTLPTPKLQPRSVRLPSAVT